jgi:signal transduction histidine kinase
LADTIQDTNEVIEYTWIDGRERMIASQTLLNDWIIAVEPYTDEVYKAVRSTRVLMYGIILIGAALAAMTGVFFGRKIVQPIEQIVLDINKIGLGDYENEIEKRFRSRNDEVGILANSVERMRLTQKESFEQINAAKSALEMRVAERTEELIQTNEYLEESMAQLEEKQAEMILTNEALEDALEVTRLTQKQLIESEKIAALGYLVGGIAHEINTPVGNSVTLVTYIQKESVSVSEKLGAGSITKSELLDYIKNTTEAADTVYRNLKTTGDLVSRFKQLAASESKESIIHFNVNNYLHLIATSMGLFEERKNIQVEIDGDDRIEVFSDAGKFSQVFTNLIANSLQHGFNQYDEGRIQIDYELVNDQLMIKYHDNGSGIEKDHLDSIYTPFFTTKFSGETKGLGLNIVYNVVTKLFDGSIKCESEIGEGTTFFITMRMKGVSLKPHEKDQSPST